MGAARLLVRLASAVEAVVTGGASTDVKPNGWGAQESPIHPARHRRERPRGRRRAANDQRRNQVGCADLPKSKHTSSVPEQHSFEIG
jgi:hypothetical protein